MTLSITDAQALVRKNMDELGINDSAMLTSDDTDDRNIDTIIEDTIAQAIDEIHRIAPLERIDASVTSSGTKSESINDKVLTFEANQGFLRLVSFQAADSGIVVGEAYLDSSIEGKKQANKFVRGTYDNPRLIMHSGSHSSPKFSYYSLQAETTATAAVKAFKYVSPAAKGTDSAYTISADLKDNIIDQLTGMVLAIYKDSKAEYFLTRAKQF